MSVAGKPVIGEVFVDREGVHEIGTDRLIADCSKAWVEILPLDSTFEQRDAVCGIVAAVVAARINAYEPLRAACLAALLELNSQGQHESSLAAQLRTALRLVGEL